MLKKYQLNLEVKTVFTSNNKNNPQYFPQIQVPDITQFKTQVSQLNQADLQALADMARKQGISENAIVDGLEFINKL